MKYMKEVFQNIPSSRSGIASVIHYPENKTDKLAILCPGYLDTKDYAHLVGLANELCAKGFVVARFDPTGTWGSGGDISDYTTTQYLEDIKYVLDYMLARAQYKTILLGGHSRGGQMSILYAARDSRVNLVLGIMPSAGPVTGRRREEWKMSGVSLSSRDVPADKSQRKEFRVPFNHVLDRDQYDAIADVKKINVPIVLISGELDDTVLPEKVKKIFDNANEPKKLFVLDNIGHDYRLNDDEVKLVNEKIMKQLAQFL